MHVEQKPGDIKIHQKQSVDQILAKYDFEDISPLTRPRVPNSRNITAASE